MASWGLLQGLGQGLSFSGERMAKTQEEEAKEARLAQYQKNITSEAREHQKTVTAEERTYREGQDEKTVAGTRQSQNGLLTDVNKYGTPIGEPYSDGKSKPSYDHLRAAGKGTIYDAATGQWITTPDEDGSDGQAGSGSKGKAQVVTLKDDLGQEVLLERTPEGMWKQIVPEGTQPGGIGPAGLTWGQAEERATAMASDKAGLLRRDETDFGLEGRQGFITRTAQELYQGKQGQTKSQPRRDTAKPIDQATIQRAMGNPEAMREVLRQLNPGASQQEIEAALAEALNQSSGNSAPAKGNNRPAGKSSGASGEF